MTQKRWLILAGAWMLVFVGFYSLVWRPNISDIRQSQSQIRIVERQLMQLMRDVQTWPSSATRTKMENYEKRLEQLFSMVPEVEDMPQLLEEIEQQGVQQAGLRFVSLQHDVKEQPTTEAPSIAATVGETPAPAEKQMDNYTLVVKGDYMALLEFLYRLENAPRLINLYQFTIQRVQDSDIVQATLMLDIFHTTG